MTTSTYAVSGLTCEHCVGAVGSEIKALAGVTEVDIALVVGGESLVTVTSQAPLDRSDVAAAVDEAGNYELVGA
jgi:copper chaperone